MKILDLTSAVLQIPLEESSTKYTAFLFETNVSISARPCRNEKFAGGFCTRFEESA
jgi:hypothetical protein